MTNISSSIESSEIQKQSFIVRDWYGNPIQDIRLIHSSESVWRNNLSSVGPNEKPQTTADTFKLDHQPPEGTVYTFGEKFYQAAKPEPKFSRNVEKWGPTSVFVKEIDEEKYRELVGAQSKT